jgi:hypothetical protein
MKLIIFLSLLGILPLNLLARGGGGGGFRGGGMGEEGFHMDGAEGIRSDGFEGGEAATFGDNSFEGVRGDGFHPENSGFDAGYADREDDEVRAERIEGPNGEATNVNVKTPSGRDYDATVAGPDGYRNGYVWQDGGYVAVNCDPYVPYAAPFGPWLGWSVVTQPEYINYPVYATYPVETAVQVALQGLGLYTGPIDGNAQSCTQAIEQYEQQNGLDPTGTITPQLLASLGIQASE